LIKTDILVGWLIAKPVIGALLPAATMPAKKIKIKDTNISLIKL
jgi:hypothetical protein